MRAIPPVPERIAGQSQSSRGGFCIGSRIRAYSLDEGGYIEDGKRPQAAARGNNGVNIIVGELDAEAQMGSEDRGLICRNIDEKLSNAKAERAKILQFDQGRGFGQENSYARSRYLLDHRELGLTLYCRGFWRLGRRSVLLHGYQLDLPRG